MLTLENYLDAYDTVNKKYLLTHELGGKYTNKTLKQELECTRQIIDSVADGGKIFFDEIDREALVRLVTDIDISQGIELYFSQSGETNQSLISCMRKCASLWAMVALADSDDELDLGDYKILLDRALDTLVGGNSTSEVY